MSGSVVPAVGWATTLLTGIGPQVVVQIAKVS